jgi:hypothetical protein
MQQQHDGAGPITSDFRDGRYDGAIRTKIGAALRNQYNLRAPMPQGLIALLRKVDASDDIRDDTMLRERLFAQVDECVAAVVTLRA